MDKLFKLTPNNHPVHELHLSGIACLHIAIKFDNMRCHSLQDFVAQVCRDRFTPAQVARREREILAVLKYKLVHSSIYDWCDRYTQKLFLRYGVDGIEQADAILGLALFIGKAILYQPEFYTFSAESLGIVCVAKALEIGINLYPEDPTIHEVQKEAFNKVPDFGSFMTSKDGMILSDAIMTLLTTFTATFKKMVALRDFDESSQVFQDIFE